MKPEILAPVGDRAMLDAAIRCGADAVYLGAGSFNARQYAENFTEEALAQAVADCHARGVRVHLTLNTLVCEDELEEALAVAGSACACGVDALIVQDRGLARRIHAACPSLPLHASTQLSCHNPAGVIALRDAGFSRVVLAREMTKEEIAACCGLGCEIECFVHGALCMSVSGQCYLSAMLGGRSGNRGRCAQPCRLPFSPADSPADTHALSLKDLSLTAYIRELADLGVCSLKIEGRMKRPEYVAAAVTVCRQIADGKEPDPASLADLQAVFSRSGFTDGYYTARRGREMFGIREHADVTAAQPVLKRLRRLYDKEVSRIPVSLALTKSADTLTLSAADADGHTVTVTAPVPSGSFPENTARIAEQLRKTGGTPYAVGTVSVTENTGLPVSLVNGLRRDALGKLSACRAAVPRRPFADLPKPKYTPVIHPVKKVVRAAHIGQVSDAALDQTDILIVPLSTPSDELAALAKKCPLGVEIPRGLFGTEDAVAALLKDARIAGAVYALCGNVGAIPPARAAGLKPVGGFGLNLTNADAAAAYREDGLCAATLSFELTLRRMRAVNAPLPLGAIVYGRLPLMLMRNCPRASQIGCAGCAKSGALRDRTDTLFPLTCGGGTTELLNSVPLWLADKMSELPPLSFWLFHFTTESSDEVSAVLSAYENGAPPPKEFTRGLYFRGVQ